MFELWVVLQYLGFGPALTQQLDDELDGNPRPLDDRLADEDIGVQFDSLLPVRGSLYVRTIWNQEEERFQSCLNLVARAHTRSGLHRAMPVSPRLDARRVRHGPATCAGVLFDVHHRTG